MAWVCDHCHAIHDAEPRVIRFADLTLNEPARALICGVNSLHVTPKEALVLADMMPGRVVSKEALMMRHFDESSECSLKSTDVMIHKLRRKLKAVGSVVEIKTLWALGFQLVSPGTAVANTSDAVHFGDMMLNVRQRSLTCGQASAPLRPQTTYIMEDLMRNFSAPEKKLIDRYIGRAGDRIKNLRVQMTYIRRALAEIGSAVEIVNTRGEGYWIRMRPGTVYTRPDATPASSRQLGPPVPA